MDAFLPDGDVRSHNRSPKVGDTLKATASAAVTKYEWSLNGTVMATTATYEVPASAKDGDEIKVTVTAEDGETASDVVYVGGLTILKVEPLAQGDTYKFVKAYFSSALATLSPSEIEIRGKKDQKLYSIQTAVLSTDGMAADLTLYGNAGDDGTTYLYPNTTYVMTLTQNGQSTSLEFELPAYATDKIVTSVDVEKNTITTDYSYRTGEAGTAGTFNVAGKYAGNLGTLIGRTVNYGYDTDLNLTNFTLDDAEVVYGAMKYVDDANDITKAYFKDLLTGETYKVNKTTRTASKNYTWFFAAEDGDGFGTPVANRTYNYVKLVLNPDGTISTANIVQDFPQNLYVTEVDGTKVIQDKNNAFDLDGYTIVKDDEYVATADLEIGDVVFVNTTLKFADVFTATLSGEISNVVEGKLDIDETTYNWDGAQYYDEDDDEYKTLSVDADSEGAQAYLNSLDTETDTTIWIARNKTIKYLEGTVVGVKKYTYETYLIGEDGAQQYTESLKNKFNIPVFDGTNTETITIDLSQLKFYKGVAGKFTAKDGGDWKTDGEFTFKGTTDDSLNGNYDINDDLLEARLVKFMYDEDGALVGFSDDEDKEAANFTDAAAPAVGASSLDGKVALKTANSPNLTDESSKFVQDKNNQDAKVYTMGSYTTLWIYNQNDTRGDASVPAAKRADNADSYKKVVLTDFTNEIETKTGTYYLATTYRVDGTKLTDLVVTIKDDSAYAAAETQDIVGVLDGVTYKNDSTDTTQVVKTITIYGTDGAKVKYTANEKFADITGGTGGWKAGDYVTLTQDKSTELITAAEVTAQWSMKRASSWTATLDSDHATTTFHNNKLILSNGAELTTAKDGVILKRYEKEGSWKYDIVDYTDVNTMDSDVNVWYNETYVSTLGDKIQSDMIVVQAAAGGTVAPTTATVKIAGEIMKTGTNIASTGSTKLTPTVIDPDGTIEEIASWKWYYMAAGSTVKEAALVTATQAPVTTKALVLATTDGGKVDGSQFFVVMTDSDGNTYTSNTITMDEPVMTLAGTETLALTTKTAASMVFTIAGVKDQFGETMTNTSSDVTIANDDVSGTVDGFDLTSAKYSVTGGTATVTLTGAKLAADNTASTITVDLNATNGKDAVITVAGGAALATDTITIAWTA